MSEPAEQRAPEPLDELLSQARRACERAYAPYSHFPVGAAVDTDAGVFAGCNVENASYGSTICAERVAAAAAVAGGATRIRALAVSGPSDLPTAPCGACRQFLYEFGPEMTIVSEGTGGARKRWQLTQLLPDAFGPSDLDRPR